VDGAEVVCDECREAGGRGTIVAPSYKNLLDTYPTRCVPTRELIVSTDGRMDSSKLVPSLIAFLII